MTLPATEELRRRLHDSYDLDLLYWETMGLPTGDTKEKPLRQLAALLEAAGTPYALIGGVAVQLYSSEPRSTKDIDIAVPTFADVPRDALERAGFSYEGRHPHSDNWRAPGFGGRKERIAVQFSAEDIGLADAVAHAKAVDVEPGLRLRVVAVPDLAILKLAAAAEPRRRQSKAPRRLRRRREAPRRAPRNNGRAPRPQRPSPHGRHQAPDGEPGCERR